MYFLRRLWQHYLENNDALIFVVDSSDRERFPEAKEELWGLLDDDRLRNSYILILANKQDLPRAASASEISDALDLYKLRDRQWFLQATCATTGEGLVDGLSWLASRVKEKKSGRF